MLVGVLCYASGRAMLCYWPCYAVLVDELPHFAPGVGSRLARIIAKNFAAPMKTVFSRTATVFKKSLFFAYLATFCHWHCFLSDATMSILGLKILYFPASSGHCFGFGTFVPSNIVISLNKLKLFRRRHWATIWGMQTIHLGSVT